MDLFFSIYLALMVSYISAIDIRERRIPNSANLLVFVSGLFFWWIENSAMLWVQIGSAFCGFILLWTVRFVHLRLSKRVGLGMGDVKMAGACAAWFHPIHLPIFLLIATSTAIVALLVYAGAAKHDFRTLRFPFGPFLSAGLLCVWFGEVAIR